MAVLILLWLLLILLLLLLLWLLNAGGQVNGVNSICSAPLSKVNSDLVLLRLVCDIL